MNNTATHICKYDREWITIIAGMGPGAFPYLFLAEVAHGHSYKRHNHCVTPYMPSVATFDASMGRN